MQCPKRRGSCKQNTWTISTRLACTSTKRLVQILATCKAVMQRGRHGKQCGRVCREQGRKQEERESARRRHSEAARADRNEK
eukprot:2931199-Pleurochrysis_carterae.AAC.1